MTKIAILPDTPISASLLSELRDKKVLVCDDVHIATDSKPSLNGIVPVQLTPEEESHATHLANLWISQLTKATHIHNRMPARKRARLRLIKEQPTLALPRRKSRVYLEGYYIRDTFSKQSRTVLVKSSDNNTGVLA